MNIKNVALLCLCLLGAAGQVEAQETTTTVSQFDLLKSSRAAESQRRSAARRPTKVATLAHLASLRADSLTLLRQEIAALRAHSRIVVIDTIPGVPEVLFVYDTVVRVVHDTVVRIVTASDADEQVLFTVPQAPVTLPLPAALRMYVRASYRAHARRRPKSDGTRLCVLHFTSRKSCSTI